MADTKISALSAAPAVDPADLLALVDVSDTTMAASGSTRRATVAALAAAVLDTLTAGDVPDLSATYAGAEHTHEQADVSGLAGDLAALSASIDGKADIEHDHDGVYQPIGSYAAASHTHTASAVTDFAEAVDDRVAALLVAGSGVTLTYDDGANTLTVTASGGSAAAGGSSGQVQYNNAGALGGFGAWDGTSLALASGRLAVGASSPVSPIGTFALHCQSSASTPLALLCSTIGTAGASGGAGIIGQQAGYGAGYPASGDRLAYYLFGAAGTSWATNGAGMVGLATQAWGASAAGSKLVFQTTPNGSTTRSDRLEIGQDGAITALSGAVFTGNGSGLTALSGSSISTGTVAAARIADLSATYATVASLSSYLTTAAAASTYQPLDADLTAIAGLTSAADRLPYFTGSGTASLATFTAAGRALVDDADAEAQRTTLGLAIGTDVLAPTGSGAGLTGLKSLIALRWALAMGTDATTGTNKAGVAFTVPYSGTITRCTISAGTAPSGQALICDINKAGTSIWASTQANRIQLAAGATAGSQASFDTTSVSQGDALTIDVDQVGSGTAGQTVLVELWILTSNP